MQADRCEAGFYKLKCLVVALFFMVARVSVWVSKQQTVSYLSVRRGIAEPDDPLHHRVESPIFKQVYMSMCSVQYMKVLVQIVYMEF